MNASDRSEWTHRIGILFLTIAAIGCESSTSEDDPGVAFTVRDSAGVEIVENGRVGAWGDSLLGLREDLRIGAVDGEEWEVFGSLRSIEVLEDGRILAGDLVTSKVHFYRSDGTYLRSFGRAGDGPGDLRAPVLLHVFGDTLWVVDGRLSTLSSWILSTGEWVESDPLLAGSFMITPLMTSSRGWTFTGRSISEPFPQAGTTHRYSSDFRAAESFEAIVEAASDADGSLDDRFPVIRGVLTAPSFYENLNGVTVGAGQLWGNSESYDVSSDGRLVVAAEPGYRVETYEPERGLVRVLTRRVNRVPIDASLLAEYREVVQEFYRESDPPTEFGGTISERLLQYAEKPIPEFLPVLGSVLASTDGAVLVNRPDRVSNPVRIAFSRAYEPEPQEWDFFDSDGRFLGTVEFPARFTPLSLGEDWVVGRALDDLDVQYIVRYRIERPE